MPTRKATIAVVILMKHFGTGFLHGEEREV